MLRILSRSGGRAGAAAVLLALVAIGLVVSSGARWAPRQWAFDLYQRVQPRAVDRLPARVIDIDEASLERFGQWPWPRTLLGALIEAVAGLEPLAIGLDIVMPEPDRLSPGVIADAHPGLDADLRARLAGLPSNDDLLASVVRRHPVVVARVGFPAPADGPQPALRFPGLIVEGEDPRARLVRFESTLADVPQLEAAARGHGLVNRILDDDGIVRRVPVIARVGDEVNAALSLEVLRVALGQRHLTLRGDRRGVVGVGVGDSFIPLDRDGTATLHFSPSLHQRRVSALDVLEGRAEPGSLAGHIAIVGVTALGTADAPPTPVDPRMDGVEVQAQLVEVLLDGARLTRPHWAALAEAGALLAAGLALIFAMPRLGPLGGAALVTILVTAIGGGAFAAFAAARLLLDPSFAVLAATALYALMLSSMLAEGIRQRRLLDAALGRERLETARLAGELGAAREIQMGMLPDPARIPGLPGSLEVHALLEPAREVGGDLYDFVMLDEHRLFFAIGDVSGKGIPASLFMALSKALCRSVALRSTGTAGNLLTTANEEISRENPALLFLTAVAGVIDARTGAVDYCVAGHDAPWSLRAGEPPRELETDGGPPLCALDDFPYPADRHVLAPGETLLMTTDGVTEAMDNERGLYGRERVLALLTGTDPEAGPGGLIERLYEDVKRFAGDAEPSDDLTVMAIRYRGADDAP